MTRILTTPVSDPSAWRTSDFDGDDSWIIRLGPAERAELTRATSSVLVRGLEPCAFDKEAFSLPTLSKRLERILDELENGQGFVMLRGIPLDGLDDRAVRLLYSGIGAHLGTVITQNSQGERIGEVTDRGSEYATTGVRGHGSRAAIRPHCDSADVVGLLCVSPAARGGSSLITSSVTVYNELLENHPELIEVLCRGFRINLAGKGPTGRADELSRGRIPVFSYYRGRLSCR
ncbi:MAG: TauD/TfdA family dioxygenase, partial [Gammaproteobacteria bacterium]|nr:TauD/TfdA family dioxygenase [Gammaproteobacteria bacterium]